MRWHTSSYSGGGEGNDCVEVAVLCSHVSIRDSKAPTRATVTVQAGTFATSIRALKGPLPQGLTCPNVQAGTFATSIRALKGPLPQGLTCPTGRGACRVPAEGCRAGPGRCRPRPSSHW
ncbi:DUF397 domain-containing protein [Streptomyces sp. NPDC051132]|uniref:DUF397 domain-containing protein n=1 Tax=unclassified Streptomyces TaxID=2593676 RepID=UPI00342206C0